MHPNLALFANEAFYLAFNQADFSAMQAVWSDREDLRCLHPGWPLLKGREAVLDSWHNILQNPQGELLMLEPTVTLVGEAALVLCYEQMGQNILAATNLFVAEGDGARLLHHHAGPCAQPPADPEDGPEPPPSH